MRNAFSNRLLCLILRNSPGSQIINTVSVALLNCTNIPINTFRKTKGAASPWGQGYYKSKTKITTAADPSSDTESQDLADSHSYLSMFLLLKQESLKILQKLAWSMDKIVH